MKSTQNLPAKLKELRKQNHYSQEYVAEQLNISRQAISHWENGRAYPDIDNLVLLAELYGVSVDELLEENAGYSEEVRNSDKFNEKTVFSEILMLAIVLILSSNFPMIGIVVAVCIIIWLIRTKRHYKSIYFLCLICIIMGIHELFTVCAYFSTFNDGGSFIILK